MNEWNYVAVSLNKNLRWQTQIWQTKSSVIYLLKCVSIFRCVFHFLWLKYIGQCIFYRTMLYMLIYSCTRLIQNEGVWDWQKLNSKCLLKKIETYFQGDLSPEEFTRTLFKKIYLNPNGGTLLHDMGLGRCVIIFTERTTLPLWRRK